MSPVTYFEEKKMAKNWEISTRPEEGERCHSVAADKMAVTDKSNKNSFGPNTFVLGTHYYFVVI